MNAIDRLRAAHAGAREGRHAQALDDYVWFHHHALEEEPALRGVRLSYALAYWMELAQAHPPALDALLRIRDDKAARLAAGEEDIALFRDVEAIDATTGHRDATHALFVAIDANSHAFAGRCFDTAFATIVAARDYTLARRFLVDPEAGVRQLAERLNDDVEDARGRVEGERRASLLGVFARNYADEVLQAAIVLRETGEPERAAALVDLSQRAIADEQVRAVVRTRMDAASLPLP